MLQVLDHLLGPGFGNDMPLEVQMLSGVYFVNVSLLACRHRRCFPGTERSAFPKDLHWPNEDVVSSSVAVK